MKKTLIALAALGAFAGAASAQSSVTLYGLVDLSVQYQKGGDTSVLGDKSLTRLTDGTAWGPGSRWGLRVSEDLGSGLKANVVLESGFNADTGTSAQGGRLFGRQAFISLASATLGEIRLGRQYALHDEVMLLTNPFGNATLLNPGAGAMSIRTSAAQTGTTGTAFSLFIDAPRYDNALQYISPSFGGFRVQGMFVPDERTADRLWGLKGTYANGPLNVALSYERSKSAATVPGVVIAGEKSNQIAELGANYDFGVVKLFGGYQQAKDLTAAATSVGTQIGTLTMPGLGVAGGYGAATDLKAYTVGASVPLGAFTVAVNYTRAKFENDLTGADATLGRIGLGATYSLSKLTSVYTAVAVHNGDLKNAIDQKQVFQIGLRKAF